MPSYTQVAKVLSTAFFILICQSATAAELTLDRATNEFNVDLAKDAQSCSIRNELWSSGGMNGEDGYSRPQSHHRQTLDVASHSVFKRDDHSSWSIDCHYELEISSTRGDANFLSFQAASDDAQKDCDQAQLRELRSRDLNGDLKKTSDELSKKHDALNDDFKRTIKGKCDVKQLDGNSGNATNAGNSANLSSMANAK